MLFSEIYSAYYNAVAYLIEKAIDNELNIKNITNFINETAFSESFLYITAAIQNEDWSVINKDFQTPIKHKPKMPLSNLQLAFLKSIVCDKRFALFSEIPQGLEHIEPLYTNNDFYIFDQFEEGDHYEDEHYKAHFRMILKALKEKCKVHIEFTNGKGNIKAGEFIPRKLEFSSKDDKFRVYCKGQKNMITINLARITQCHLTQPFDEETFNAFIRQKAYVEIEINDKRNALERMMTTFANYKKETLKINEGTYRLKLAYNKEDETELLIRILSFGPMVKVVTPQSFIRQINERIHKQIKLQN